MSLNRLPFDKAVRTMLQDATGKPVGLYVLPTVDDPANPGEQRPAPLPYYVLYALPATFSGPPFDDDHADVTWLYQLTCVAERPDQAVWLRDRALAAMVGRDPLDGQVYAHPIVVAGMSVTMRRAEDESPMDDVDSVVSYPQRYSISVTPA